MELPDIPRNLISVANAVHQNIQRFENSDKFSNSEGETSSKVNLNQLKSGEMDQENKKSPGTLGEGLGGLIKNSQLESSNFSEVPSSSKMIGYANTKGINQEDEETIYSEIEENLPGPSGEQGQPKSSLKINEPKTARKQQTDQQVESYISEMWNKYNEAMISTNAGDDQELREKLTKIQTDHLLRLRNCYKNEIKLEICILPGTGLPFMTHPDFLPEQGWDAEVSIDQFPFVFLNQWRSVINAAFGMENNSLFDRAIETLIYGVGDLQFRKFGTVPSAPDLPEEENTESEVMSENQIGFPTDTISRTIRDHEKARNPKLPGLSLNPPPETSEEDESNDEDEESEDQAGIYRELREWAAKRYPLWNLDYEGHTATIKMKGLVDWESWIDLTLQSEREGHWGMKDEDMFKQFSRMHVGFKLKKNKLDKQLKAILVPKKK